MMIILIVMFHFSHPFDVSHSNGYKNKEAATGTFKQNNMGQWVYSYLDDAR